MIIVFTTLCIANLVIHYEEVELNPANSGMSGGDIFFEVFSKYWISLVGSFIAVLVRNSFLSILILFLAILVQHLRLRPLWLPHVPHKSQLDHPGEAEARV